MAFVKVEKGPEEVGRYWKPSTVGEAIEGNIYAFVKDEYGLHIDLYRGIDEDTQEYILTQLPAHADLKRSYVGLNKGDYIRVEVTEVKEPKGKSKYPKLIYDVFVDEDRAVEFPE